MRDRIVAETRGNPLALLELPRGLTSVELAGGFGIPDTVPLANRIEEGFIRRLEELPTDTRRLLLTAAVEPVGDVTLLWQAAEILGIGHRLPAVAAEESGLIEIGARVRFRHPLVRSAACRSAGEGELRRIHSALAEVTNPVLDPDRRAWHRAHAAMGPDEDVAAELMRSADRAQARGGISGGLGLSRRGDPADARPVISSPAIPRRGATQISGGCARSGASSVGSGGSWATRRAPTRPGGPLTWPDCVRLQTRQ